MFKKRLISIIIVIFGYLLSYTLYRVFGETLKVDFCRGDFFWIIGMPIMCFGGVLFLTTLNAQRKSDLGLFSKILLLFLAIVWIIGVYLLFWTKLQ